MSAIPLTTAQLLSALSGGPLRIATAANGVPSARLHATPVPGQWSANDVLAHLRACADLWGGCIAAILSDDHPTLRAINPRAWIAQTDYLGQPFADSLHAYSAQRAEFAATLEQLAPEDWMRAATVRGAGKALERTVHFYVQWLARHERAHLKQIERLAKAQP